MLFVERILLSFFQSGCFLFHFLAQISWRNSSTMFSKCGERGHTFLVIDLRGNHLVCVCMLKHLVVSDSLQPLDCSLPGSSVHGISQARILEWVAISSSKGTSQPRDQTRVSCVSCSGRRILCHWVTQGSPVTLLQNVERLKRALHPW